jgi:hypothetical protein
MTNINGLPHKEEVYVEEDSEYHEDEVGSEAKVEENLSQFQIQEKSAHGSEGSSGCSKVEGNPSQSQDKEKSKRPAYLNPNIIKAFVAVAATVGALSLASKHVFHAGKDAIHTTGANVVPDVGTIPSSGADAHTGLSSLVTSKNYSYVPSSITISEDKIGFNGVVDKKTINDAVVQLSYGDDGKISEVVVDYNSHNFNTDMGHAHPVHTHETLLFNGKLNPDASELTKDLYQAICGHSLDLQHFVENHGKMPDMHYAATHPGSVTGYYDARGNFNLSVGSKTYSHDGTNEASWVDHRHMAHHSGAADITPTDLHAHAHPVGASIFDPQAFADAASAVAHHIPQLAGDLLVFLPPSITIQTSVTLGRAFKAYCDIGKAVYLSKRNEEIERSEETKGSRPKKLVFAQPSTRRAPC